MVPPKDKDKENKKNKVKIILSEEVLNSGEFKSDTKREYASYMIQNLHEIKNSQSAKKSEKGSFKAENYIDASLLEQKSKNRFIVVCEWGSEEVAVWLNQIGFGDCIEDFK